MNFEMNPRNHEFIRYSVYNCGHLVFTSLDKLESLNYMNCSDYITDTYRQYLSINRDSFVMREEVCNLKGYVIYTRNVDIMDWREFPEQLEHRTYTHSYPKSFQNNNMNSHTFQNNPYQNGQNQNNLFQNDQYLLQNSDISIAHTLRKTNEYLRYVETVLKERETYDRCGRSNGFAYQMDPSMVNQYAKEVTDRYNIRENDIPNMRTRSFNFPDPSSATMDSLLEDSIDSTDSTDSTIESIESTNSSNTSEPSFRPKPLSNFRRKSRKNQVQTTNKKHESNTNLDLSEEMAKLAANLNKQLSDNIEKTVEEAYPELREDIQIDKEIKKMENEYISDTDSEQESDSDSLDNYYDKIIKIDTHKKKHNKSDNKSDTTFDIEQIIKSIPSNVPDNIKSQFVQLLAARNHLQDTIEGDEELVNKANNNLNEEQFEERCRIQDEKRHKKKLESQKSVLSANKISYLKMRSKIVRGTLKENNIPLMFNDKYCVLRYMEINELVSLASNDEIDEELRIYNALYKTIEAREYEANSSDSDSDYSPLDDVEEDFVEICSDFMEYLEEHFPNTISESKIHDEFNKDITDKNKIFHNDYSKDDFVKDNDSGKDANSDDLTDFDKYKD